MRAAPAVLLLLALSACAGPARRGDVDMGMILPAAGASIEIPENRQFLFPTPIGANDLPEYPPELVALGLPELAVCLQIVVDEHGGVPSSAGLFDEPGCPDAADPPRPEFLEAAQTAVARWQFLAAAQCVFPAGMAKNDDCEGAGVEVTLVPVRLAYAFTFRLVDGRPRVDRR